MQVSEHFYFTFIYSFAVVVYVSFLCLNDNFLCSLYYTEEKMKRKGIYAYFSVYLKFTVICMLFMYVLLCDIICMSIFVD